MGKSAAELPLFKWVTQKGNGVTEESGVDGTRRILAFTPLMDTIAGRIYLWIGVPKDAVTAPAERELVSFALISLTVLAATFGMLWRGGVRWFVRPVSALSGAAQRINRGSRPAPRPPLRYVRAFRPRRTTSRPTRIAPPGGNWRDNIVLRPCWPCRCD